jgi:Type I phosphodiesterase / nucleotide pyrophosphatase
MKQDAGVSLYVLIDALGWEILRDRPFLDDILQERYQVETILGYSSGAIPTVLTGQYPNEHGHWNLFYRAPATSPFRWTRPLRRLPHRLREWRGTRRGIKEIAKRLSGYSGYFAVYNVPVDRLAYYDICETSDIYQPGGLAPARSLFDVFATHEVPYECYNYHQHTDQDILSLVPQRLQASSCQVYFLYLSQLDSYLHFHVDDEQGVSDQLRFYEDGLRTIYYTALAQWGQVRLTIFSDHGMTPIRHTVDLIREVERLDLRIPEDYLPAYDSTMARFWVETEQASSQLCRLLDDLPYGKRLTEAECTDLRLTFDDDRYGHLIFLLNPGTLMCPSDMGRIPFAGMHGFHPQEDPSSYAVFLSSERHPQPVTHIAEIFPTILSDLELRG